MRRVTTENPSAALKANGAEHEQDPQLEVKVTAHSTSPAREKPALRRHWLRPVPWVLPRPGSALATNSRPDQHNWGRDPGPWAGGFPPSFGLSITV